LVARLSNLWKPLAPSLNSIFLAAETRI
jgi:hypothetical protein